MKSIQAKFSSLLVILLFTFSANAAIIYVDPGDHSSDYLTVLSGLGYSYTTFNSYDDASWATAVAAADVILVGERHFIYSSTSAFTHAALGTFVSSGGTFVGHSAYSTLGMDELFNAAFASSIAFSTYGCTGTVADSLNVVAAAGTSFAGGPATIDDPSCTFSVSSSSLPAGALDIYNDGANTSVFASGFGSGAYSYLGWDFCVACASAEDTTAWTSVLDSAINFKATSVPESTSIALLGLGLIGVGLSRRKKRI